VTCFLLDTNVVSEFAWTGRPDENVDRFMKEAEEDSLFASVLTFAEIRRGVARLPAGKRRTQLEQWEEELTESFEGRLIPVTKSIADRWAILSVTAQRMGITLGTIDGLIAATAVDQQMTLVTRNVRDFAGVDVVLLNPWTP